MNRDDLFRACRAGEGDGILCEIIPDLRLAIAPTDGNRRTCVVLQRRAQVGAVDVRNGTGAADIGGDLAVAGFDLIAEDMSLVVGVTIGAGCEI